MITYGRHRSLQLAERHAKQLAREYPGYRVKITARMKDNGELSSRGRNFTFKLTKKRKKKKGKVEYVLHFDYGNRKAHNLIRFQIHVIAPKEVKDETAIENIREWDKTGKLPKGWSVEVIYWGHPEEEDEVNEAMLSELEQLRETAIQSGSSSVSRKNPV